MGDFLKENQNIRHGEYVLLKHIQPSMFQFFKKDPKQELEKEYKALLLKARDVQRSGDIVSYSAVVAESVAVLEKIKALENKTEDGLGI